jgi:hypothetical protein
MRHAERNALSNAILRPEGGVAYVTGTCCNGCLFDLWQERVETIYTCPVLWGYNANNPSLLNNPESEAIYFRFRADIGDRISIIELEPYGALEVLKERYVHFTKRVKGK